jgi:Tol biopolymer transport system component
MKDWLNRLEIDRLDWTVWGVLAALALATGLVLLRGDRVGAQISGRFPAPGSANVSTRTEIRVTFDEPMDEASVQARFHITPPVSGTFDWRGKTLVWRPGAGLDSESRYTVSLAAGARSAQGRRLRDDVTWTFSTRRPRLLYLHLNQVLQLYQIDLTDRTSRPLTQFTDGSSVWDYASSPDGAQIAFGLVRPDGSAVDLWRMAADGSDPRVWVVCDDSQCSGPAWSPDGRRLAYERRSLNADVGGVGGGLGPSRVWLLDVSSGQTRPLFEDTQKLGFAPRWSPDGARLAYFDPQGGVRILDLNTGDAQLIPNQLGEIGSWSPDGLALALVDLRFFGERSASYLIRADLTDGSTRNLSSEDSQVDDGSPAWSPTGEWIAFGRKALADGASTPGRQLWLMRPDGSQAHPLATDPQAHLGAVAWAPDGQALAYQRFPLMQANARPEIWYLALDGSAPVKLAEDGTLASWLP